jgi:hypothetical protein
LDCSHVRPIQYAEHAGEIPIVEREWSGVACGFAKTPKNSRDPADSLFVRDNACDAERLGGERFVYLYACILGGRMHIIALLYILY